MDGRFGTLTSFSGAVTEEAQALPYHEQCLN